MIVNLRVYLETVKQHEMNKPENERRPVPTLKELAREIPMDYQAFTKIANSKVKGLTLSVGDTIISSMRRRGFPMQVSDLLVYYDDVAKATN